MKETLDFIRCQLGYSNPEVGFVLGSGLNYFADEVIDQKLVIPYRNISGFPVPTALGHKGNLVFGSIGSRNVVCMQGRFHTYEGHPMSTLVFPIRVMCKLGIKVLVLTNAAGGIKDGCKPGAFMLISDHINLMGTNPLIGINTPEDGPRFPDMSSTYHPELIEHAERVANRMGITVQKGVYLAVTGPSFETPAEIRAFRVLGADAVGMSTVPEAITASQLGIRVLGISCITNKAAGLSAGPVTAEEVMETADRVKADFSQFLGEIVRTLPDMQEKPN